MKILDKKLKRPIRNKKVSALLRTFITKVVLLVIFIISVLCIFDPITFTPN